MKKYMVFTLILSIVITTFASASLVDKVLNGIKDNVSDVIVDEVKKVESKIDEVIMTEIKKIEKRLLRAYIIVILINMAYSTILIFALMHFSKNKG